MSKKSDMRMGKLLLLVLGVLLLLQWGGLSAQDFTPPLMKTGLIHKFAQHTEWEGEDRIDTFRIGMYGQDPELHSNLIVLESLTIKDKPVMIEQFNRFSDITRTHLLYVTRDNNLEFPKIVNRLSGNNTLIVSDRYRNQDLIMINFLPLVDGKPDFEVNKANIINAKLDISPDLLLLGGTEVDVAGLYKQSQKALSIVKDQIGDLTDSFQSKSRQIEELNREIEKQSEEMKKQKRLLYVQMLELERQQEAMDANAAQLASVLSEVELKQETLDSQSEFIRTQKEEIETQRKEILIRNRIKAEQEKNIAAQEKEIYEQESQLSNMANVVARQRTFLYIIIAVCGLIGSLVFFIYRGYRIKKNANQEIEMKNRELQLRQEEIIAQSVEIQQANEEVIATNEALENQKGELQFTLENLRLTQSQLIQSEKMASVGVLTAGIAHELNNPINFVSGNVNPLRRDLDDIFSIIRKYDDLIKAMGIGGDFSEVDTLKEKVDYSFLVKEITSLLEGIEEGAIRSSQIVKGLRSFSRLDEEKCQIYDVHEGIDSTLILLHNKIKNKIKVRTDYGDFDQIECYPSKLNQVIMNILTNSIQAIKEKGEIVIQTVGSDLGIKIIIKDNGPGMSTETKEHIFEPFYTTKDVGKGTGLGLSISFGIIEQHHGNIDVISEPGKGAEFIISLPRTQPDQ